MFGHFIIQFWKKLVQLKNLVTNKEAKNAK